MEKKANGLSIAGFVVSLVGMFIAFWGIVPLVGLILSAVGRKKAVQEGGATGMATAGIVLGVIGVVWAVISMVACTGMIAAGSY